MIASADASPSGVLHRPAFRAHIYRAQSAGREFRRGDPTRPDRVSFSTGSMPAGSRAGKWRVALDQ